MIRGFRSQDGSSNGRVTTVNGAFGVSSSPGGQQIMIQISGPKGAERHYLILNWSDALLLAVDIIKATPQGISGAYYKDGEGR